MTQARPDCDLLVIGSGALTGARSGLRVNLRNENALVARRLRRVKAADGPVLIESPARPFLQAQGQVAGARLAAPEGALRVHAGRGLVLTSGGWAQDRLRRAARSSSGGSHASRAGPEASGDGLRLAEPVDAVLELGLASASTLCPLSQMPWPDGQRGTLLPLIARRHPRIIAVRRNGRRICNEGLGRDDYTCASLAATPSVEVPARWLIWTRAFRRRDDPGRSRPAPAQVAGRIPRHYLQTVRTPAGLTLVCGIDPAGRTVWNRHAKPDEVRTFRHATPYLRLQGDPAVAPKPCVAPILRQPFHALRVIPGSFGGFAGIASAGRARALDAQGQPIAGLYAAGADMAGVMGGCDPASSITLGQAPTFGQIAAQGAADLPGKDLAS